MKKHKLKTKFKEAKSSLGFLIWKSSNKLQRLQRAGLKDLDLTPTQFSVLASIVYLGSLHDRLTQSLLSQHTEMDKMLISDVIKSLVVKKLVAKERNEEDSRSFLISATSLGAITVNKAITIVEEINEGFFKDVKDKTQFGEELNRILSR